MAAKEKIEEWMIVNRRTGKALQSTGLDNGLPVAQQEPDGSDAQLWQAVKKGAEVKLINKASGKVLDVMHGSTEAGAWAQTWEDVGGDSQRWQLTTVARLYKKIVNVQSGKVLDIVDMREDDGAPAQIWDDVDGIGQQWKLVKPEAAKTAPEAAKAEPEQAPKAEEKPAPAPKAKTVTKKAAPKSASAAKAAPKAPRKTAKK